MSRLKLALLSAICFLAGSVNGQTTVTFNSGNGMSDAMVANGGVESYNFGNMGSLNVSFDPGQQIPMAFRSFIQFDVSSIPEDAIIVGAQLSLFPEAVNSSHNHSLFIERVAYSQWSESSITWNNQPDVFNSSTDMIPIPHSQTVGTTVHQFDVTKHVQKMVNYPEYNNGWRIRLQSEQATSSYGISYYSSESSHVNKHPVLTVDYILPISFTTEVQHCSYGNEDGSLVLNITGGSSYSLSNMDLYLITRDTTKLGDTDQYNYDGKGSLSFNAVDNKITATGLEPGIYLFYMYDDLYFSTGTNDKKYMAYKHILIGREGEVTKGILHPFSLFNEDVHVQNDKPTNPNPLDRLNTNYSTWFGWYNYNIPNYIELKTYFRTDLDFDSLLYFSKADLHLGNVNPFTQSQNSSNATNFSLVTSPWNEDIVTWNKTPSIDTSFRVHLPATGMIGTDTIHTRDTVSLLSFYNFWQKNPHLNYGVEIALNSYDAPESSSRSYRGTEPNNNYIELEYTVAPSVQTVFNDTTGLGEIIINAPSGELPYTFLVGTSEISSMNQIWNDIKNSTRMDSTYFFSGKEYSIRKTIKDLHSGEYHIAVFDNKGVRIFTDSVLLSPKPEFYFSENLQFTNYDRLSLVQGSQLPGMATLNARLLSDGEGGVSFNISSSDNSIIGFNYESDPYADNVNELEFGFELNAGKIDLYYKGVMINSSVIANDDRIEILRQGGYYLFKRNNEEIYRVFDNELTDNLKLDVYVPVGSSFALSSISYRGGMLRPSIIRRVYPPTCEGGNGSLKIGGSFTFFTYTINSIVIKNQITNDIIYTGYEEGVSVELPVGVYELITTYTVPPIPFFPPSGPIVRREEFVIGYDINWLHDFSDNITESLGSNNIRPTELYVNGSTASENLTPITEDWWYNFKIDKYLFEFLDDVSYAEISFKNNDDDEALKLYVEPIAIPGAISKYVELNDAEGVLISNNQSLTIAETSGELFVVNDSDIILPLSGDPYLNTVSGTLRLYIDAYNNIKLNKNKVSYCKEVVTKVDDNGFATMKRNLDGGYYDATHGKLYFEFDGEYKLDPTTYKEYKIYTTDLEVVAGVLNNGGTIIGGAPLLIKHIGENKYVIDLDSLGLISGYYFLEIVNIKGEKNRLRFLKD